MTLYVLGVTIALLPAQESAVEQSRQVLQYGIDSEVIDLLQRLDDRSEDRLDSEILERFEASRNNVLRIRILEFFEGREVDLAGDAVREILLAEDRLGTDFLRVAVRYLSRVVGDRSPQLLERYREIARDEDLIAGSVAIEAIGSHGSGEGVTLLLELYEELSATELRGAVIRALGETGSLDAVDLLTRIVTDSFEEGSLRQYAAASLGKIGAPESLGTLTGVLSDADSLLRAYAIGALGYYSNREATAALTEGLRDSFWRVRVAALQGLAEQRAVSALAAIAYKARRDPEAPVRQAALQTLAALESAAAFDVLREIVTDVRAPLADRMTAADLLVKKDLSNSLETVNAVIDEQWAVENSRLLDTIAKALVTTTSSELAAIYGRLLSHPNYIIRIYAIRGVGRSGLVQFGEEIQRITAESSAEIIRSNAMSTLELLGLDPLDEEAAADPGESQPPAVP